MKKTIFTDAPRSVRSSIKAAEIISDFLPRPDELVFKEDNIKVTLEFSKESIVRFKRYANRHGFKYQRMIRNLVDQYALKTLT